MAQNDQNHTTQERLLNEAEILFAEKGYHAVSVREITKAADCNLAAINYHFGNKQNLYLEVFRSRWAPRARRLQEHVKNSLAGQSHFSAAAMVKAIAQAFLEGPLSEDEQMRHYQLITREMAHPTEAFELVAKDVMRPAFRELADGLRSVMPEGMSEERLMLNILSIFGMVLYFNFARVAVTHMINCQYDQAFKARLVEHITNFSLTGLGIGKEEESR